MKGAYFIIGLLIMTLMIMPAHATITSISEAKFISNDPTLNKDAFLVTVTVDGSAQKLTGEVKKEDMNSLITGDKKAKSGFNISFDLSKEECVYPIERTYDILYRLEYETEDHILGAGADDFEKRCFDKPYTYMWFGKKPWSWTYYCIWLSPEAEKGRFSRHMLDFATDITISIGEKKATGTIGNYGKKGSIWLKDPYGTKIAYATWNGLLWSGVSCPAYEANYATYWDYTDKKWKIVKEDDMDKYFTNNDIDVLDTELKADPSSVETKAEVWNDWLDKALAETTPEGVTLSGSTDISGGEARYTPSGILYYPQITLRIDADWIGIYLPVGKPIIKSVSTSNFKTGEMGYIDLSVENAGDVTSTFEVVVNCPSPFSSATEEISNIKPGEIRDVSISITGSTSKPKECGTCTIEVYDKENPDYSTSNSVYTCVESISMCPQIGLQECIGRTTYRICKEDGWYNYKCPEGTFCHPLDSRVECSKEPTPLPPPSEICNYHCEAWDITCKFQEFLCKTGRAVGGVLLFIGFGIAVVVIIWLIWKIIRLVIFLRK